MILCIFNFSFILLLFNFDNVTSAFVSNSTPFTVKDRQLAIGSSSSRIEFVSNLAIAIFSNSLSSCTDNERAGIINLPLENCGGSFCTLFSIEGEVFRGVLDTGSPFLTVAGSCTRRWGCYAGQGLPSGLGDTVEVYAVIGVRSLLLSNFGPVQWKKGIIEVGFLRDDLDCEDFIFSKIVFGVLSDALVSRPGGVFLGLIKFKSPYIRPTFLGQVDISAFRFDFRNRVLSLSRNPLISPSNLEAIQLIDLRKYGDSVMHYAAEVTSFSTQQSLMYPKRNSDFFLKPRKMFVIFDTGTTGMAVSRGLFDMERKNSLLNHLQPFRNVKVTVKRQNGMRKTFTSKNPLTTPIDIPWPSFNEKAHLVVIGLEFMENVVMTIDADRMLLLWND